MLFGLKLPGMAEHLAGQIHAIGISDPRRHGQDQSARPAGHIEDHVLRLRLYKFDLLSHDVRTVAYGKP
jgi:hypothetical protein